jgi:uncharacterized protein (UPF0332 family)
MTFDWKDYQEVARDWQRNPLSLYEEASVRSSISRAYYAAFCTSRNFARDNDKLSLTKTGKDHSLVSEHFKFARTKDRKRIGVWLKRLKDNRRQADYEDIILNTDLTSMAQSSITITDNLLKLINTL